MDYDEKNTEELEAELYSRIHHDKPETIDTVAAVSLPPPIQNRTVSRHSVVNNNKMNKKAVSSKNRKKAVERCNPNPFAFASAVNNHIPKRFTPYTSYLSQVDSQPITSLPNVQSNDNNETEIVQKPDERRPNPFNKGFNRTEEKMKRVQQMEAKKARANKVREEVRLRNEDAVNIKQEVQDVVIIETITKPISVPESDSDDEVYIYPPEQPTVISSDEEETNAPAEKEPEPIDNLPDDCDAINVDYDKRLSRHDDPFGGIDVAHLNTLISADPPESLPPAKEATDHFAKPQRANRQALKRSYDVQDTDFAATDVYESESSDLPENIAPKGRKLATVLSESEGSDVDTSKRSKRMRKRRKSGSNRGSDHFSSDDSDDDGEAYLEPGKTTRPYYLHRGEGVFNAVTKYSKRVTNSRSDQQHRDVSLVAMDSSEDSQAEEELDIVNGNWVVTDTVGETDDIELNDIEKLADVDKSIEQNDANVNENNEQNESNVDKDDNNGVGSERLVIHPEMGWNREMRAFYNDSWGGETHNMMAIRKQMPKDSFEWRIDPKDLRANYNVLGIRCHNCRENGHRMASCPQPKKQVICFTCGMAGHREIRCPNAICLRCGRKTHSFRRGCEGCFGVSQITCKKCRRRGHYAQDCPDNWRAYHNTTDPAAPPIPASSIRPKRCCSVCAGYGHRAEQCYDFQLFMQDDAIPVEIRQYEKVYDDPPIDNSMSTPYSMFENPRENFRFVWKVNENRDRVYGRFMEATKIQRDASTPSTKRRKKAKIPKTIEKFVLNPMNAQNIRDKPKKQFAKNFYEESPTKNDADRDVVENETNAPNANVSDELGSENTSGALHESGNADSDVVMKELDPIEPAAAANNSENSDESQIIQRSADDELMQEAIEVDNLRGRSANFSFSKEMDDLEKSRALFDLSFIGSSEHHEPQEINLSPIIPTKARAEKMRKAEEIEQLTEMEISLNKLKDDIVLNVTNASDQSLHCVHDSDSNYSFGEYFNESKSNAKEKEEDRSDTVESPDYIPLPPHIDSSDIAAASDAVDEGISAAKSSVNSAKIFLTKQHARLLLSTESGNKLLHDASNTHNVKVRMDWENLGNVLIVVGTTLNQNKFHADLIRFLVEMCKKMRIKNETFQQVPKSKMALIRFIREQFALLEQPLGNVTELYKNMRRNENLKSKNGTKNADRARKNLNIILMGRAGLREGRLHLAGLESNLKFLLNNNKEMMTKQTREEIYQHYRYVFSPFEHDDYPDLISEYEEMKRSKAFPPLNIDRNLLEIKISVKDDAGDLGRAKQKLMRTNNDNEPQEDNHEPVDEVALIVDTTEPKTSTPKSNVKREPRTPKQHGKSPKADQRTPKQESKAHNGQTEAVESVGAGENSASVNKNAVWSLKCKDIVEQCRQKHIKSSKVVDKLNMVLEKASRNELSYADYKSLEPIVNTLNRTVN